MSDDISEDRYQEDLELARKKFQEETDRNKAREGLRTKDVLVKILFDPSEIRDLGEVLSSEDLDLYAAIDDYYDHQESRRTRAKRALRRIITAGRNVIK